MRTSSIALVVILPLGLAVMVSLLRVRGESCGAMTLAEPGDDRTSLQAKAFANFRNKCRAKKKLEPRWPRGVYGFLKPTGGCPTGSAFTWQTGSRNHDTEDDAANNYWSEGLHLMGPISNNNMWQDFCMKTAERVVGGDDKEWSNGQYCVFKYGDNCPSDMSSGSIFWDDENNGNANSVHGTVPSGVYDQDTLIHFCCMIDGVASDPITLPTSSPFYLFAYTAQCQEVEGMNVTLEWFRWDDENTNNGNYVIGSHPYDTGVENHLLHFCYYQKV